MSYFTRADVHGWTYKILLFLISFAYSHYQFLIFNLLCDSVISNPTSPLTCIWCLSLCLCYNVRYFHDYTPCKYSYLKGIPLHMSYLLNIETVNIKNFIGTLSTCVCHFFFFTSCTRLFSLVSSTWKMCMRLCSSALDLKS